MNKITGNLDQRYCTEEDRAAARRFFEREYRYKMRKPKQCELSESEKRKSWNEFINKLKDVGAI